MSKPMQQFSYFTRSTLARAIRLKRPASWVGHIPFAFWIVEHLRPRTIVELGTHTGNSFCAFNQALDLAEYRAQTFAVDHWQGDAQAGFYAEEIYSELKGYVAGRYPLAKLIRSTFDDALDVFSTGEIDLLHIDGLHTYEAVKHDFELWRSRLSDRAVVLLHDSQVNTRDFGVYRFVAELGETYSVLDFRHSHGLAVIGVGTEIPQAVSRLLANDADINGIDPLSAFSFLGQAADNWYDIAQFSEDAYRDWFGPGSIRELESLLVSTNSLLSRASERSGMLTARFGRTHSPDLATSVAAEILSSGCFDPEHYSQQSGLDTSAIDLAIDYLKNGEKDGLCPSRSFNPNYYRDQNPDLAEWDGSMLLHYVRHGRNEGRIGSPT